MINCRRVRLPHEWLAIGDPRRPEGPLPRGAQPRHHPSISSLILPLFSITTALTNDILGKIDSTSKTVSSFLPDTSGLTSQLSGLTSQLGSLYDTYSSQFCTEASFDFGEFHFGSVSGHRSVSVGPSRVTSTGLSGT